MAAQHRAQVALLHFAGPPGVGGVEAVMRHHAVGLRRHGHPIRIIAGVGSTFQPDIETVIEPLFASSHPEVLAVKQELDAGIVSPRFAALRDTLHERLQAALEGCAVCIAHNVTTLHKNLALTAALHRLSAPRLIAWCHDLAWTNPQYRAELHEGYPWDLLRTPWPGVQQVTISTARQHDLAQLYGVSEGSIQVIPGGVDPAAFLRLTPTVARLAERLRLLEADGLLLYPTRLTRRKNIEFALETLAALRQHSGQDMRLIVTGPPGPHNPANRAYLDGLLSLRERLNLNQSAHFLYQEHAQQGTPLLLEDEDVSSLYHLADALFFPSAQEGFGIPMLEAGMTGLPILCSDLPPLREIAGDEAHYFDPQTNTPTTVATRIHAMLTPSNRFRLRRRVRHHYTWEAIIRERIFPLLEAT